MCVCCILSTECANNLCEVLYTTLVWYILVQQGCVACILYSYFSEDSVDFNIHKWGIPDMVGDWK